MAAVDSPTPLATSAIMRQGPLGDLVQAYSDPALDRLMVQATRLCESECQRRLVPFTITESHRAEGVDPDELTNMASMPLDMISTLSSSYASALGASDQVRHVWLREYAPRYQEMWQYGNDLTITIIRSIGGQETFTPVDVIGPEPDTGHVWFRLGTFLPIGSLIRATYSGGYQTIPGDLERACQFMAGGIAARDLDPAVRNTTHDAGTLTAEAVGVLTAYART